MMCQESIGACEDYLLFALFAPEPLIRSVRICLGKILEAVQKAERQRVMLE
jgi:hypothetical protein